MFDPLSCGWPGESSAQLPQILEEKGLGMREQGLGGYTGPVEGTHWVHFLRFDPW